MSGPDAALDQAARMRLDWRIARVAAGAALLGSLIGGCVGLAGTWHQTSAEDERVLRQQQAEVYSGLLSTTTRFALTVPRARSYAQGGTATRADWSAMNDDYGSVADAAALAQVLGSENAKHAAGRLQKEARNVHVALYALYLADGPQSEALIAKVDDALARLVRAKADYLNAAREDLVPAGQ